MRMRTLIEERASGNPFYIEQVVLSLIDSDHVEVRDGNLWATDRPGAVVIPATVEELLMARIDQLPLPARQVLHIASIVGRSSHQRILASVAEDPELESHLETLRAAQLLTRWERAAEIVWEFKHPLIQEVAYEAITRAKRRDYHRRIAESIEATFAEGRPGRNGMLAYHFSLARDLEQAERYLFLAGDEAVGLAASSEALHFFQEASKLYFEMHGEGGDPAKKAILEGNIGQAQMNRGQFLEAVEHYNRALEHLGEHVPRSQLAGQASPGSDAAGGAGPSLPAAATSSPGDSPGPRGDPADVCARPCPDHDGSHPLRLRRTGHDPPPAAGGSAQRGAGRSHVLGAGRPLRLRRLVVRHQPEVPGGGSCRWCRGTTRASSSPVGSSTSCITTSRGTGPTRTAWTRPSSKRACAWGSSGTS